MADGLAEPVVLDATVLSNFASSAALSWLVELLDRPVAVDAVRDELERGRDLGYGFLVDALDALGTAIPVVPAGDLPNATDAHRIRERLDAGEAASLLVAAERGGCLATDDLAARRVANAHDVPVTGSIGLLVVGVERDTLAASTADEWLTTWRAERGYHAPVDSISDVLEGE